MIDTDKYEGHVADFGKMWTWSKWALLQTPTGGCSETKTQMDATSALLNDAPLLLAEVKRLRIIEDRYNSIEQMHTEGFCKYDFESDGVEGCWFCEEERLEREEE